MKPKGQSFYVYAGSRLINWARREWLSLIVGAAIVGLVSSSAFGPKGPRDLLVLRRDRAKLEARRALLEAHQIELKTIVRNLRSNDRYLEHLIRRELGYARPDELVYKFTGGKPSSAER